MLTELTVAGYVERLASDAPTPGGGSAAALAGALGAALGEMVGNFTVGREKYREAWDAVGEALARLTECRRELLDLTARDADAYALVGAAYGLPRATEGEKTQRGAAIQEALLAAARVPLGVCDAAMTALDALPVLLDHGNPNLVSDVGVAAELCRAALRCAWLNVEVNLASVQDAAAADALREGLPDRMTRAEAAASRLWDGTVARVVKS